VSTFQQSSSRMKNILAAIILVVISGMGGWFLSRYYYSPKNPKDAISQIKPRPLDKYAIENLSKRPLNKNLILQGEVLQKQKGDKGFTPYLFSFTTDGPPAGEAGKKVTGQLNIPDGTGPFPVIIMIRGYVDQKIYETGIGTRKAAAVFAENGFITAAPDFLGYAGSDKESSDIFESRFQTYTTMLDLISSLGSIEKWDKKNTFIWGHSNGGQVALTVLEISGLTYPTTLWAPVSKPFPYSILYYTDESDDRGKLIRRELANFEGTYDVELYSLTNYLDRIKSPLQIHQGTADDAVPITWTNELVKKLEGLKIDVDYIKYPGADHNLQPSWDTVVSRDLTFFKKRLKMN